MTNTQNTMSTEYAAALEASGEAVRAYRAASEAYRAKRIGDDEFIAARRIYNASSAAFDAAFADEQSRNQA